MIACGNGREPDRAPEPTPPADQPVVKLEPRTEPPKADPAPTPQPPAKPPTDAVPAKIGPLAPLDRLRPLMKQRDALAVIAEAKIKTTTSTLFKDDAPIYETAIPGVFAQLVFSGGRLSSIELQTGEPATLAGPLVARWGKGEPDRNFPDVRRSWPAAGGWYARLEVYEGSYINPRATLELTAQRQDSDTIKLADPFPVLAKLVGARLGDAETILGPALHRETADEDDQKAESGSRQQGYALLKLPWIEHTWDVVIRTEATGDRIRELYLSGWKPIDDAERIKLFDSLKKTFGAPRIVVGATGRVEIELGTATLIVQITDSDSELGVLIKRR